MSESGWLAIALVGVTLILAMAAVKGCQTVYDPASIKADTDQHCRIFGCKQ